MDNFLSDKKKALHHGGRKTGRVIFIHHYQYEIKGFISLNVHTLTTSKKSPKFWGFCIGSLFLLLTAPFPVEMQQSDPLARPG
jgi:hypothetical protein